MISSQVKFSLKRAGLTALSLLVVAFALAGCGGITGSPSAATPGKTGAPKTSAAAPAATVESPTSTTSSGSVATTAPALATTAAAANEAPANEGGQAGSGDEPTVAYNDPGGLFSFSYPRSWGKTTQPGETIRYTGRDEFISVIITSSAQAPLDFAKTDSSVFAKATPDFKNTSGPQAYKVGGYSGAMIAYTWQAGPSPVTNKLIPSSANRYYIAGPGGKLAIFTYSSPTNNYDPAGADDFANAFRWLK